MITFDSIHADSVTFEAASGFAGGAVCKITANGTVGACSAGDFFCGVAGTPRKGCVGVQMSGYAVLPYTGSAPALGNTVLAANGSGGVKAADSGRACCVVTVDTAAKTVGLFL
ncbi:MAG: hypothetical protein IJS31_03180 [Oscillospiraceae bacterium]|nr:hypothetical protein [Oscillospiraceae bacterium]